MTQLTNLIIAFHWLNPYTPPLSISTANLDHLRVTFTLLSLIRPALLHVVSSGFNHVPCPADGVAPFIASICVTKSEPDYSTLFSSITAFSVLKEAADQGGRSLD